MRNLEKIILLVCCLVVPGTLNAQNYTLAPDGTYVGGSNYTLTPDGTYVGGY